MSLERVLDEIASQADDFLARASNRAQARAGIAELLNADYPQLTAAEREKVTVGVMAILEAEDFFGTEYVVVP